MLECDVGPAGWAVARCAIGARGEGKMRCQVDISSGNARIVVAARTIVNNSGVVEGSLPGAGVMAILACIRRLNVGWSPGG